MCDEAQRVPSVWEHCYSVKLTRRYMSEVCTRNNFRVSVLDVRHICTTMILCSYSGLRMNNNCREGTARERRVNALLDVFPYLR